MKHLNLDFYGNGMIFLCQKLADILQEVSRNDGSIDTKKVAEVLKTGDHVCILPLNQKHKPDFHKLYTQIINTNYIHKLYTQNWHW